MAIERKARQHVSGLPGTEARFEALYELLTRLAARPSLASALNEVLLASLDLVGADAGYIRLFDPSDIQPELSLYPFVAHKGISDAYIDYFSSLPTPVDLKAREDVFNGRRVTIEDMFTHPAFLPHREVVLAEGYRSLQATPLMSQSGSRCVGAIHTYFFEVYTPPASVFETLDLYAELAATGIDRGQRLAALASRESMFAAVVDKQAATLKQLEEHLRLIEDLAFSLDPEEIRRTARALRDELRRATVEMSPAGFVRGTAPHADPELELHPHGLSSREMEVMVNVWRGLSDKQIAARMGISRFTVAKHLGTGMRKMNVETRTQASVLFEREALYKGFA